MVERLPLRVALLVVRTPAIIAFGNPLLDVYVFIKSKDFLKKHNLPEDGEMELPNEKMQELLADLPLGVEQKVSAGGSAQNSMRILQWLFKESYRHHQCCVFAGGCGRDLRSAMMEKLVQADAVDVRYAVHPTLPTGQCIAFINDSFRSLVANIGAAAVYTLNDLKKCYLSLDTVKVIYIEGFFLTHSFPVAKELVRLAEERDIIIAFNLNGVYIFKDHSAAICEMVGHAKIVFGNTREMEALAQALNIKYDDVTEIPFLLNSLTRITVNASNIYDDDWLRRGGIFVMTQGESAPAITVWGKGQSVQVHPFKPESPVVDTTGAGDALAAGFLAGVIVQWKPYDCLEYGCKVASFMVTRLGVTLPADVPPDLIR